jgi:Cu2+-exporting ATPase
MLIDILIVSTVYMGFSLYKKYKSNKKQNVIKKPSGEITTALKLQINTAQEQAKYYSKTSMFGMGMMFFHQFNPILHILSLGLLSYNSIPIFNSAKTSWFEEKKLTNNFLNSTVIMLCIVIRQFFVASLIGLSYHLGIFLLEKAQGHSKKMLVDVYSWQPQFVWVLKDSVEIEIPLAEIKASDILIVHTGETIPVDGAIVQGSAMIDEQGLTGESQPIEKIVGNQVFASTLLISGSLQIAVKKTGRETTIAEIGKILNHSAEYKTQTQLNGEIWADKAVVPQIGLAAISWPAFGINGMGGILKQSFGNIIRILVSLDTINHLTIASRNRILIKQGQALENLGNIDTVLFDKTGTLTTGQLQVTKDVGITLNEKTILSTMKRGHGELADLMDTLTFIKKEELHILEQFDFHLICNLYTRFLKFFDQRTVFL